MAKLQLVAGTTSKAVDIFIQDSSLSTGAGLTGLVFNTGSLTAYYHRQGAATATAITLVTMTVGTWTSSGFVAVDGTNMPGLYLLGIPDAALASGATWVVIMLKGAPNMAPVVLEIELTADNNQDAVRGGLSALPNAAAAATGGLPTVDSSNAVKLQSGTSANQISLSSGLVTLAGVTHTGAVIPTVTATTTATNVTTVNGLASGVITAASIASDAITAAKIADGAIDAATFAAGAINAAAIASDAITDAKVASDVTIASVTGAVGSVTGAVGSVTGNVAGSVASVTIVNGLAANVITATSIAADAITAAKIATDAIDADAIAASAVTEIQSGLATPTNITAGTITTVTNLTNAPTLGDLTATMKTSVQTAATAATPSVTVSDKNGFSLSALGIQAIWDALTSALTTAGGIGKLIVDNLNATITSRMATFAYTAPDNATVGAINTKLGTPAGASVSVDIAAVKADTDDIGIAGAGLTAVASAANLATLTGYVDTEVAAILAAVDTEIGTLLTNVAAILGQTGTTGVVLSTAQREALADAVLGRARSNSDATAAAGSLYELIGAILESNTSTGAWIIYKSDGSTVFSTRVLATDAGAIPIIGVS